MKFYEGLLEKSIESFKMAIEIYYKPMIQYRIEGFAYYMCNAWELMLKSYMIQQNGKKSIFFQDNPERTLSFENCIQKVFTNNKDPLRLNLEKMLDAQKHPENYKQLVVRIWGWSAYFVELDKEYQDHVIARQAYTV